MTISRSESQGGTPQPDPQKRGIVGRDERREVAGEIFESSMATIAKLEKQLETLSALEEPAAKKLVEQLRETIREMRQQLSIIKDDLV